MKGYWISLYLKVDNQDNMKKYSEAVVPLIKSYGGKPIVRGGRYKTYEGKEFPRTVIWEFPTYEKAIECHDSKSYQEGWALAKATTERYMQVIEGFNIE